MDSVGNYFHSDNSDNMLEMKSARKAHIVSSESTSHFV